MSSGLTVGVRIEGVRGILAATRRLPDEAQDLLRTRSMEIAEKLAGKMRAAAVADSPQSALMAPTIKAKRDRVPVITAGGQTKVGRNRVPALKILFGSEFGSSRLKQYRPHLGSGSYWFFNAASAESPAISREWKQMADELIRRWGRG